MELLTGLKFRRLRVQGWTGDRHIAEPTADAGEALQA